MTPLRRLAQRYRMIAAALIGAALLVRALVPGGYMLMTGEDGRTLTLTLCTGMGPATMQMSMPMPGKPASPDRDAQKHDSPCTYAGLSLAAMGGADPVQLVLALLFIFATAFAAITADAPVQRVRLRPPLRGPPLPA